MRGPPVHIEMIKMVKILGPDSNKSMLSFLTFRSSCEHVLVATTMANCKKKKYNEVIKKDAAEANYFAQIVVVVKYLKSINDTKCYFVI